MAAGDGKSSRVIHFSCSNTVPLHVVAVSLSPIQEKPFCARFPFHEQQSFLVLLLSNTSCQVIPQLILSFVCSSHGSSFRY